MQIGLQKEENVTAEEAEREGFRISDAISESRRQLSTSGDDGRRFGRRTAAKTRAKVPLSPENRVALKQRSAARQRGFGSRQNTTAGGRTGRVCSARVTRPETSNETKAQSSEMRNPPEAAASVQPWNPRVLSEAT